MYRCTVAALTAPTDAAKYDFDHNVGSRDRRCGNSPRSRREVNPLSWFAMYDGEAFGRGLDEQVHVVGHDLEGDDPPPVLVALLPISSLHCSDGTRQDGAAVLRAPHHMVPEIVHASRGNLDFPGHGQASIHALAA